MRARPASCGTLGMTWRGLYLGPGVGDEVLEDERQAEQHAGQGRPPRDGEGALPPAAIPRRGSGRPRSVGSHLRPLSRGWHPCPQQRPHMGATDWAGHAGCGAQEDAGKSSRGLPGTADSVAA